MLIINNSKFNRHSFSEVTNHSDNSDEKNFEEIANSQSLKLEQAKRQMIDIESRGNNIGQELHFQTMKMKNINENTSKMNNELNNSNGLLRGMLKRENRNRIVIGVFSFAFVLAFLFIFILK